jgi:conjugative relaxase-like TrwC/TraI family protein
MMSRPSKIKNTSDLVGYFAKDDYYFSNSPDHQNLTSWYGSGSKELGLEGVVTSEEAKDIFEGKLPNGQIIGTQKGNRIVHDPGRQFSISAPKSVSIMSLVYEDKRLIEAHNQAVKITLDEIERNFLKTRFKKNGEINLEATGKMVAATIRHELSRDLDPQLHTHVLIANLTSDEKGKWRTAFFDEIFDNHQFLGLVYRAELAKIVKELGYDIELKGKDCFFEIKGVPNELLKSFSQRSEEIRTIAGENATSEELEKIANRTRKNKIVSEFDHNLGGEWRERAKQILPNFEKKISSLSVKKDFEKSTDDLANRAVGFAIEHLSERQTVFSRAEIISAALNDTLSKTTLSEISKAIDSFLINKELLSVQGKNLGKNTYTTKALLEKENAMIKIMTEGKNTFAPIVSDLSKYSDKFDKLNDGQKRSAELILTTKDAVIGIQGFAGTGKTTMLEKVNEIVRAEGYKFIGLSPTGAATRNLADVGGINSQTLESFLPGYAGYAAGRGTLEGKIPEREKFKDKIVVVDECSMISTSQMKDLITIAKELQFRLVLIGDRRQLDSVGAGIPFYELLRNGMVFADMREILRQKTENLKAAVYSVIKRQMGKAFNQLDANIVETKEVTREAVKQFISYSSEQRSETIILTPANETRERVNKEISQLLYEERIKEERSKEYLHEIYKNKNLTEAEKTRAYRLKAGDVISFLKNRDFIGVKKGDYCEVTKIDTKENLITIKTGMFSTETFNPIKLKGKAEKNYFEVFEKEKRVLYEGDKIAFSRSIPELGVINSDNAILKKIGLLDFHLQMQDGSKKDKIIKVRRKSPEARLIDHSYAVTAHKAQGLTKNNVIAICESYRNKLTTQKNFYVEISRAVHGLTIIADDKEKVLERLEQNTGVQISAREHQGIEALGINMIGSPVKKEPESKIEKEATKNLKSKKNLIHDYHPSEIKEHFLNAIKASINIDAKDIDSALEKALENKGKKVRFGKNKIYEVCWHGEAGYVKSYKTTDYFKWGLNSIKEGQKFVEISKEEALKKQIENQKAKEEQEKQKIAEELKVAARAKKYFEGFFKASSVNTSQNKYLQKKGINQKVIEGVRFTKDDKLAIPVHDTKGIIQSLQIIDSEGKKTFLTGGKKMGNFFMIDSSKMKDSKEIYLAEGFATGVSVHMATNKPVAVTFDAGNLEHVLKNLKEAHPNKEFTIAADNDLWKESNIGKEKAELAARKFGAKVILPNFTIAHKDETPTDFNDLHKLSGIKEVQKQIQSHQVVINHEHHHDLHI